MGRMLVVEELTAANIPQRLRHWKGLKVKPYITATCSSGGYVREMSTKAVDCGGMEEVGETTATWRTPFLITLLPVETRGEIVTFSFFVKRSLKPDKLVAKRRVSVADFVERGDTHTYDMTFAKEKLKVANGGLSMTMKITGRVEDRPGENVHIPPPHPPERSKFTEALKKVATVGGAIISLAAAIVGVEQTVANL